MRLDLMSMMTLLPGAPITKSARVLITTAPPKSSTFALLSTTGRQRISNLGKESSYLVTRSTTCERRSACSPGDNDAMKSDAVPRSDSTIRSSASSTYSPGLRDVRELMRISMALWATVPRTDAMVQAKASREATWCASHPCTVLRACLVTHSGLLVL